jgi:hypothetical protein
MKRYFVKSLSVLGKNNKKYEAGQEVKASNFEEGVIDILVKEEHLEVVEVIDEVAETPIVEETETETEKETETETDVEIVEETAVEIVEETETETETEIVEETPAIETPIVEEKPKSKKSTKTNTSNLVD